MSVAPSGNIRVHHAVLSILLIQFTALCFAAKVLSTANKQQSLYYKTALMSSSADDALNPAAFSGHVPVLFNETLELLAPRAGAKILDGTFGGGGHTRALLSAAEDVTLVAVDRDPDAAERAKLVADEFGERFRFYPMNFGDLADLDETGFDGILFDFGLSSFQLDQTDRGFSFRYDAPVDMRMDPTGASAPPSFLRRPMRRGFCARFVTMAKRSVTAVSCKRSSMHVELGNFNARIHSQLWSPKRLDQLHADAKR